MVETQVSVSIKALGPPMRVLTHPGCIAMIRIPVSLRSTERLFIAIFNPLLLHLQKEMRCDVKRPLNFARSARREKDFQASTNS